MDLRKQSHIAVLTRVRDNMHILDEYRNYGRPACPEGFPLVWHGYDHETEVIAILSLLITLFAPLVD
ncbi:MAG: hypothetical protein ACLQBC_11705 [Syntrophales bacterium]